MKNNIYVFDDSSHRVDKTKAKAYTLSSMAKSPAWNELMKFIFDGCHGFNPEISGKTIDDAFDCVLDNRKATLYARNLSDNNSQSVKLYIGRLYFIDVPYFQFHTQKYLFC